MSLILVLIFAIVGAASAQRAKPSLELLDLPTPIPCPCNNATLCAPVPGGRAASKEVFAFQVNRHNWRSYDWDRVTTVILYDGFDGPMLCHAHALGKRVVWASQGVPYGQLANESFQKAWAARETARVVNTFTDGVNVDFEEEISSVAAQHRKNLTDSIVLLGTKLRRALNGLGQVTFDVAWSAKGIDERFYDYNGIIEACDFVVIMDYDTRSQVFLQPGEDCLAGPNAPKSATTTGVQSFLALNASSPSKLVLGVPWYGYRYRCQDDEPVRNPSPVRCRIKSVTYRGCNCTDAAGEQFNLPTMVNVSRFGQQKTLLPSSPLVENTTIWAATFDAIDYDIGAVYQYWFDTSVTLALKYRYARTIGLRGISMWNVDSLSNTSSASWTRNDTAAMWRVMDEFLD